MRKLVVAGMLGLAAFTGGQGTALSQPLFHAFRAPVAVPAEEAPIVLAQAPGDAVRIQQLQEEIRQLNGRVEEMSFQLLQMQEQMRKTQEDNEFRFQDLEKGGASAPKKKSEAAPSTEPSADIATAPSSGTGAPAGDDIATIIEQQPQAPAAGNGSNGAPPSTLGSVKLDSAGNPVGSTLNAPGANASSSLPGVATATPSAKAAQGSDEDLYKAAYGHVLAGDYPVAEKEFQQYVASYPKGAKIADASFWLGEAQYSQGKYSDAAKTFLNGHQAYGKSPRAPEMLLKLGMSLAALDNPEVACKTLREVNTRYPNAPKAVLSKAASEQKRLAC